MSENLQLLMEWNLNSFLEVMRVLKQGNEKMEISALKPMGMDIVKNSMDIEVSIDKLDISQLGVHEEQVAQVEQQHRQAVKRYRLLKARLESYQKAMRLSVDNMVGEMYDRP